MRFNFIFSSDSASFHTIIDYLGFCLCLLSYFYTNTYCFLNKNNSKFKNTNIIMLTFPTNPKLSPHNLQIHEPCRNRPCFLWLVHCLTFHLGLFQVHFFLNGWASTNSFEVPFLVLLLYCSNNVWVTLYWNDLFP